MKFNFSYTLRKVLNEYVVIPDELDKEENQRMIRLNNQGALVWQCIGEGLDEQAIAERMAQQYDIATDVAAADVHKFVMDLYEQHLIE